MTVEEITLPKKEWIPPRDKVTFHRFEGDADEFIEDVKEDIAVVLPEVQKNCRSLPDLQKLPLLVTITPSTVPGFKDAEGNSFFMDESAVRFREAMGANLKSVGGYTAPQGLFALRDTLRMAFVEARNVKTPLLILVNDHGREFDGWFQDEAAEARFWWSPERLMNGLTFIMPNGKVQFKGISLIAQEFPEVDVLLVFAQCYGHQFAESVQELNVGSNIRIFGLSKGCTYSKNAAGSVPLSVTTQDVHIHFAAFVLLLKEIVAANEAKQGGGKPGSEGP